MKPGDIVTIKIGCPPFYEEGDKAKLFRQDVDGDWLADFTINEKYHSDGKWWIAEKRIQLPEDGKEQP